MIEPFTGDIEELRRSFDNVFTSRDPFGQAYAARLPVRAVLFPTDSYHLTSEQFHALTGAMASRGESSFWLAEVEWEPDPFVKGSHWVCTSPSFDQYTELPIGVENALWSPDGGWGVLLSHELHGLLACDTSFWGAFEGNYPGVGRDLTEFLAYWREAEARGAKVDWLPGFLEGITINSPE